MRPRVVFIVAAVVNEDAERDVSAGALYIVPGEVQIIARVIIEDPGRKPISAALCEIVRNIDVIASSVIEKAYSTRAKIAVVVIPVTPAKALSHTIVALCAGFVLPEINATAAGQRNSSAPNSSRSSPAP